MYTSTTTTGVFTHDVPDCCITAVSTCSSLTLPTEWATSGPTGASDASSLRDLNRRGYSTDSSASAFSDEEIRLGWIGVSINEDK